MRHADGGGVPHGVSPRMVGSVLRGSWDGIARILGWYCEDPGLVLRGSWAGIARILGWYWRGCN